MKLKFLGGAGTVTGSKYLLEHNKKKTLIDCGLFQGLKELRLRNWDDFPTEVSEIDSIILTHAHLDHSGYIPRLIKLGFKGKIYCTPPTKDLCKILLPDSGHIQEQEARYRNKKRSTKHSPALPLYNAEEAMASLEYFKTIAYKSPTRLDNGLTIEFFNAGHILGSATVTVSDGAKTVTFSGDIGRSNDPILFPPETPPKTDYLLIESTYGNRTHTETEAIVELEEIINKTTKRGGVIIVPAFAVGRAQLMLYYVSILLKEKRIPKIPIYLNSPMATNVTGLYCDHKSSHRLDPNECEEMCEIATYVKSPEESKRLNTLTLPMLIISASGMATGGRVIHHIKAFAGDPKNTLLFAGYQAAGTRGEKIINGGESVKIHGQQVAIRAEVRSIDNLSAHADQNELLAWASKFSNRPTKTFITHGEYESANGLKSILESKLQWDVEIPNYLDEVEL